MAPTPYAQIMWIGSRALRTRHTEEKGKKKELETFRKDGKISLACSRLLFS